MITLVLTYRNRDLRLVKNCLNSLDRQTNKEFKVVLVDYGSVANYRSELETLVKNYSFIQLIQCNTNQELWCKSRAINIVLKQCETNYFFVGDIDMMYHSKFVETLKTIKKDEITYFQVGFLNEEESKKEQEFSEYIINFKSTEEATGMTLYPTSILKSINGYDEFYNGWGSEDTDVHIRLRNAGHRINFYNETILMLHQWHPKQYRSKSSLAPFHSQLEQINASYLAFVEQSKKVKANTKFNWGVYKDSDYETLKNIEKDYSISNKKAEVLAFINAILLTEKGVLKVTITQHEAYKSVKEILKGLLGKKTIAFLSLEDVNNIMLSCIINQLRTSAYHYQFNKVKKTIELIIKL